jgi:hypothetical protein
VICGAAMGSHFSSSPAKMKTRAGLPGTTGIERTAKLSSDGCKPEHPAMPAKVKRPKAQLSGVKIERPKVRGRNFVSPPILPQA